MFYIHMFKLNADCDPGSHVSNRCEGGCPPPRNYRYINISNSYRPPTAQGPVIAKVRPGVCMLTNSVFPRGSKQAPANSRPR